MLDLFRAYRGGVGSPVTSAVKDITGREPIAFVRFAHDDFDAFR
ncbi:MAG: hypothetical protein ACRD1Z_22935 [Vicinamibacteria bacterium]